MNRPVTSRFGAKSEALDVVQGRSLAGKRAVVTGGAAGLGWEASCTLAGADRLWELSAPCRSMELSAG